MRADYFKRPEWYRKRNEEIYADKIDGMSMVEMVKKYGITTNRIYQIVNKLKDKGRFDGK